MKVNAVYLRGIIEEAIVSSITVRRASIAISDDSHLSQHEMLSEPNDEEITDFIFSNYFYDIELVEQLTDPGLLGFHAKFAEVTEEWLEEFKSQTQSWAKNNSWLAGDEGIWPSIIYEPPNKVELWTPSTDIISPGWVKQSCSYLLLAKELLEGGRSLAELHWRDFENLIGNLLENDGWTVNVTQATKDGGIDVIAIKNDKNIGPIKSVWQAKKYSGKNLVKLNEVRELYAALQDNNASKAIVVTTNRLTRDAIEWIRKDEYKFDYKEKDELEKWVKRIVDEKNKFGF